MGACVAQVLISASWDQASGFTQGMEPVWESLSSSPSPLPAPYLLHALSL